MYTHNTAVQAASKRNVNDGRSGSDLKHRGARTDRFPIPHRAEKPKKCPTPGKFEVSLTSTGSGEVTSDATYFRCRNKWCPYCGPRKRARMWRHYCEEFRGLDHLYEVTLTLDPKAGIKYWNSRDVLEKVVYKAFYEKCRYQCVTKRGGAWACLLAPDQRKGKFAHFHGLIWAPDLSDEDILTLWYRSKGGIASEAKPIDHGSDPEHLDRVIGYTLKRHFEDAIRRREDGAPAPRLKVSQRIAFRGETARAKRQKTMRHSTDGVPIFRDEATCEEWLDERLRERVGKSVYAYGIGECILVDHVPGQGSTVRSSTGEIVPLGLWEVFPSRTEVPLIESYQFGGSNGRTSRSDDNSDDSGGGSVVRQNLPDLVPEKRSTQCTLSDGTTLRWDKDAKRVRKASVADSD